VAKFLPTAATSAVVNPAQPQDSGGLDTSLLPWWAGALMLLAYGLASGAIGAGLTLRRDVT
jgi:hypothetical protein